MTSVTTPSIKRRLACMAYEAMLLFGVVFISGWLFDTLTQSRHALTLRHTRQAWLFIAIGTYFAYFWCTSGQTLAMKTWRIRLAQSNGAKILFRSAALRYFLAWLWFLPGLTLSYLSGLKGWAGIGVIVAGMLAWLAATFLDPQRQFLHDRLAGTCLIDVPARQAASA